MAKRLCCLCLAMFLVLGLAACSSKDDNTADKKQSTTDNADKEKQEEKQKEDQDENKEDEPKDETEEQQKETGEEPEPYAQGTVDGNHFESAWLNMQADFSDEYIMATAEEIAQIQSAGSDMMLNEDGQEAIDGAQEAGTVTNEMMVMALSGIPNCTIAVEKLPMDNMTAKQYLMITKQNLVASITDELKIVIKGAMPTVVIAGEEFMSIEATMYMNGVELNSNTYVRVKDGYAIVINATFDESTAQQKDELLAVFQPMKAE